MTQRVSASMAFLVFLWLEKLRTSPKPISKSSKDEICFFESPDFLLQRVIKENYLNEKAALMGR